MTPLRRRMIEDMTLRNFAPQTIQSYIWCIARFARYFIASPEHLGPEQVRAFLVHLVQERRVSLSQYKQTRSALRFLYRVTLGRDDVPESIPPVKQPRTLPVVLSPDEGKPDTHQFRSGSQRKSDTHQFRSGSQGSQTPTNFVREEVRHRKSDTHQIRSGACEGCRRLSRGLTPLAQGRSACIRPLRT
jgi:hypothetical protein